MRRRGKYRAEVGRGVGRAGPDRAGAPPASATRFSLPSWLSLPSSARPAQERSPEEEIPSTDGGACSSVSPAPSLSVLRHRFRTGLRPKAAAKAAAPRAAAKAAAPRARRRGRLRAWPTSSSTSTSTERATPASPATRRRSRSTRRRVERPGDRFNAVTGRWEQPLLLRVENMMWHLWTTPVSAGSRVELSTGLPRNYS